MEARGYKVATVLQSAFEAAKDDKARAAENQRLNAIIQSDCGPGVQ